MKNIIVAATVAATLIVPSVTFAQNAVFSYPTFYDAFDAKSAQVSQPATKLDISTTNEAAAPTKEKTDRK